MIAFLILSGQRKRKETYSMRVTATIIEVECKISNDVSEWSAYLRVKYGIDNVVDFSTISGDVKCRKPDMEIYRIAIKQTKVNASDCVFIDDRDKNLVPAMNQDMKVLDSCTMMTILICMEWLL